MSLALWQRFAGQRNRRIAYNIITNQQGRYANAPKRATGKESDQCKKL